MTKRSGFIRSQPNFVNIPRIKSIPAQPSSPSVAPHAFIVGMSRAGTTWMLQSLNRHPEVAAFGETGFWGKHFIASKAQRYGNKELNQVLKRMPGVPGQKLDPRSLETLDNVLSGKALRKLFEPLRRTLTQRDVSLSPRELFDIMCGIVADYTGKRLIVEKTPHHVLYADRIMRAYPDARFVVMMREPYGFMRSYKHQGDRQEANTKAGFARLYHPIGCALVYRGYARAILGLKAQRPDHTCLVALEEINATTPEVMRKVSTLLGVEDTADHVPGPVNSSFSGRVAGSLENTDVYWMNLLAAREIRALGYEVNASVSGLDGLRALLNLPLWGWYTIRHLISYQNATVTHYLKRWLN